MNNSPRKQKRTVLTLPESEETSALIFGTRDFGIRLSITGRGSMAQRRTLVDQLVRALLPRFMLIQDSILRHQDAHPLTWLKARHFHLPFKLEPTALVGSLGFQIRMARLNRGWSQAELAKRAGTDHGHISRIERGLLTPQPGTLLRILTVLSEQGPERPTGPPDLGDAILGTS